jgi:hypothetical protein
MIAIRPIWFAGQLDVRDLGEEVANLFRIETEVKETDQLCARIAANAIGEPWVDAVLALRESAVHDLSAGCEMVRCGYEKQAYTLWRAWLEQTIFAVFFVEAPLNRLAWKVFEEVQLDQKGPKYRLMLHQLISAEGTEKHPFALVYNDRFTVLLEALKVSNFPGNQRPLERCGKMLTTLSQGVHGTYQPRIPADYNECRARLVRHTEILQAASNIVAAFWVLLLVASLDLPEETLLSLRDGVATEAGLRDAGFENFADIFALMPTFQRALRT